jgi:hypothetical protein
LLTEIDGVQEVGAGREVFRPGHSAEVGNGYALFRGFGKKEEANGNVSGTGKPFQLLESGLKLPLLPIHELRETAQQCVCGMARTFPGPT